MSVHGELIFAQVGKRGIERHVSSKGLIGGAHEWVPGVVADPSEIAEADQLSSALLRSVAADARVCRMVFRKAHLRPCFQRASVGSVAAANVLLKSSAVIEEVELDQLD